MPSIEESRGRVRESLRNADSGADHEAILLSLQDEIDKHNAVKEELRKSVRRNRRDADEMNGHSTSRTSMKFRFKSGTSDPRKRSHHSRDHRHRKKRRHDEERQATSPRSPEEGAAHPFPREPVEPDHPQFNSTQAFRESLFDALADDEGAHYWEGVYSQPLHVYSRPTVVSEKGELEQMNDEEYAVYVKTKMWERKNPHVVRERERTEREKRNREEERTRRREEYVRRKEQAAWERAQRRGAKAYGDDDDDDDNTNEKVFSGDTNNTASRDPEMAREEYAAAWSAYLVAWEQLKQELLSARHPAEDDTIKKPSSRIPWPVLPSKAILRPNIDAFMRRVPGTNKDRLNMLKQERVKWHPDKIQQRFAGQVDEGTMKVVTGIFQVVDDLVEEERKKS
nr:hypothetical protein CFP56_53378 [Quercus suber]